MFYFPVGRQTPSGKAVLLPELMQWCMRLVNWFKWDIFYVAYFLENGNLISVQQQRVALCIQ